MAINTAQRQFRQGRIGSSDSPRIMAGDWLSLWLEKTGRTKAPSLDLVPAVQIGIATEPLHPRFWESRTGRPCMPADGRSWIHPAHDWLVCHPDFLTWSPEADPLDPPDMLLEAKFHGGPADDDTLAERYGWQLQHQMLVTGHKRAILSVLRPGTWSWTEAAADPAAQDTLLQTLEAFWWHVANDVAPEDPDTVAAAPPALGRRVLDMRRNNAFVDRAAQILRCRADWQTYKSAEAELKAMMPAEARVVFVRPEGDGDGLVLTRSRDGRISLRLGPCPAAAAERAELWQPDVLPRDDA